MQKKPENTQNSPPVPAIGVICLSGDEVLLVKRGKPPRKGEWSIPGGRIEPGEKATDAALRELGEETGVEAELIGLVDVVDGIFREPDHGALTHHYVLIDYAARWTGGEPRAGDDAVEAKFVKLSALADYKMWHETERIIRKAAEIARGEMEA